MNHHKVGLLRGHHRTCAVETSVTAGSQVAAEVGREPALACVWRQSEGLFAERAYVELVVHEVYRRADVETVGKTD